MEEPSTYQVNASLPLLGSLCEPAPLYLPNTFTPAKQPAEPCKSAVCIHPMHTQVTVFVKCVLLCFALWQNCVNHVTECNMCAAQHIPLCCFV